MDNEAFAKTQSVVTDIPPTVMVPCPISGNQQYRQAAKCCPDCPYFRGVGAMIWADTPEENAKLDCLPWSQRFVIRCNTVMEWKTIELEIAP